MTSFTKTDAATASFADDTISAVRFPKVKLTFGIDGTATDVSSTNPLPVNAAVTISALPAGSNTIGAVNLAQYTAVSGRLPVDGSGVTQPVSGTVTVNALPAGTNAIGKLAANSGVTIGAVEIAAAQSIAATQSGTWSVRLQDGSGNAITSATRGSERAATVQIVDGSGTQITSFGGTGATATDAAAFTRGSSSIAPIAMVETSAPTLTTGKVSALSMDTSGALRVNITAGGITGFAEDAAAASGDTGVLVLAVRQDSISSSTSTDGDYGTIKLNSVGRVYTSATIDAALPAGTNGIGKLTANSGVTIGAVEIAAAQTLATVTTVGAVTAITNALPTGANVIGALTANQSINNAQINGVTPLMGNGVTGTGSQRVTVASDNTAFNVLAAPTAATTGGASVNTLVAPATPAKNSVKTSAGTVYGFTAFNLLATPVYLKVFDVANASITLGTTAATYQFMIPGNTAGAGFHVDIPVGIAHATAIQTAVTAGIALIDNTSTSATSIIVNLYYK